MKQKVKELLLAAWQHLVETGQVSGADLPNPQVDRARDPAHGDFSTNLALVMAKTHGGKPRDLAARLVAALPTSDLVARTEIAGPGFINFFLTPTAYLGLIPAILASGPDYGRSQLGAGKRVQVEFVSANPTGPLHVGHGRGAAYGAVVADLLAAVGFVELVDALLA